MRITIKKIAEIAGVSRGTVDRALNNRPGVKKEVQERIKCIAEELGYKPNAAAKALADNRYNTKKIGVLLNSQGNPFFDDVTRGVSDAVSALEEFGLQSSIKTMQGYDVKKQVSLLEELVSEQVNGIVLTPVNAPEIAEKICELKKMNIEVVTINSDVLNADRMAYVGCRYKKSGAVAAGLIGLMNGGKQETFAIVGSSIRNLAVERRIQGMKDTFLKDYPQITVASVMNNNDDDEISFKLVDRLLVDEQKLDGICFAGGGVAGGLQAIKKHQKKLKIIAFDLTETVREALRDGTVLASVCQEPYRQGYDGIDILGKYLLWNQKPEKELNHTELSIVTKYSI